MAFYPRAFRRGSTSALYLMFFVPGILALAWFGINFAYESWTVAERSQTSASNLPMYPLKALIPVSGALLLLQGAAEIARCVVCLRTGQWPERERDVEEVDVEELRELTGAGR
jgi:TRAP-type mannitol/chloroaromatic compound transport system permease small subunit